MNFSLEIGIESGAICQSYKEDMLFVFGGKSNKYVGN